ncbi:Target of rapamycin complex 1 subunit kog1, partial [Coemansia biformis]
MDDACPAHGCQDLLADRRDSHTHPRSLALASLQLFEWRVRSDLRTIAGLLAVSLGLGARSLSGSPQSRPPPPSLLPVLEAWTNPYTLGAGRKTGKILGQNLARQFGYVSGSATYKPLVDCDPVRLQQYCVHFRTVAATERLLFYYNGHGMPLPAAGGGVWFPQRPDEVQPAPGY